MARFTKLLILTSTLLLSLLLGGCGLLDQFRPLPPTVTPAPTRTPIPLPTLTPTPRPPTATVAPAVQPTAPPAQPTQAAAPQTPRVSNFTARFTGRAIEGGFNVGTEAVTYIYRIQRLDVVNRRLQATGTLEYQRGAGQRGSVPGLTAQIFTEGDACERVTFDTQPVTLPEFGVTMPAQSETINLADVEGGANPAISAMCSLARTVQSNPSNPIVSFLLSQVNRQLESQ